MVTLLKIGYRIESLEVYFPYKLSFLGGNLSYLGGIVKITNKMYQQSALCKSLLFFKTKLDLSSIIWTKGTSKKKKEKKDMCNIVP